MPSTPLRGESEFISTTPESRGAPTAPATPFSPGQQVLFGIVLGGGDSRFELASSEGARSTWLSASGSRSPRIPNRRFATAIRSSVTGTSLGSPVRLRQLGFEGTSPGSSARILSHRPRPLVRAAQAPMPLSRYATPTLSHWRPKRAVSRIAVDGQLDQLRDERCHFAADPVSAKAYNEATLSQISPDATTGVDLQTASTIGSQPGEDDDCLSATVALAVFAAVEDAIACEFLSVSTLD